MGLEKEAFPKNIGKSIPQLILRFIPEAVWASSSIFG
jgi:hypothetical protein